MKPATHSYYTDAVRRVIEHVVSHLGEATALETLAAQACLSPFHFHRVFRGMVGETPLELVRRLRLECVPNGVHFSADGHLHQFIPRDSGGRNMQVEIRQYPALRVGTVRHIGPYLQINHAFARLGELAAPARLFERPGAQMVALFYDDPDTTPAEQLRSDAAVVVAPDVELPNGLTEQ